MAPSQLETGGQKAVQGTVLDAKSRLSALIKAGFSRFNKVPLSEQFIKGYIKRVVSVTR
jgi:hypothetical protein